MNLFAQIVQANAKSCGATPAVRTGRRGPVPMPTPTEKACIKCGEVLPIKAFRSYLKPHNGKRYHRPECQKCENKKARAVYKRTRGS